ncbi:MAG: hypothetical protein V3U96_08310 [Paracoccaceae bacterium]
MTPEAVAAHFLDVDGGYRFARWGRAIVPVVFGVDDATLAVVKGAIEAVVSLSGQGIGETDVEMGANLMLFFVADWDELAAVPDLDGLVPELGGLLTRLKSENASQYRMFRFEADGTIRAAFVFLRMGDALTDMAAEDLALAQAVQVILLWGAAAFAQASPLAMAHGVAVLRPEIAGLIRAAYDPVLPGASVDASHALRVFARMGA